MFTVLYLQKDLEGVKSLLSSLELDYRIVHSPKCESVLEPSRLREAQLLLLDLECGEEDPFVFLEKLGRIAGAPPVLALTSRGDPRTIVRAVRSGATDVLLKPPRATEVRDALIRCITPNDGNSAFPAGTSAIAEGLRRDILAFAKHDYPILITGESGTGKELAAQALHNLSTRKTHRHVARNCAALPTELIESELFGSTKGAFTGAADRPGAFELADGGTLFLDEIGDASQETQVKLLRALESGYVWKLGARQPQAVDVRFVSATSRNLEEAMARGSFRPDLFYRIETLRLHLPSLRERREDLPDLARFFLREAGRGCKDFGQDALDKLLDYDWPGNIRQLRNAVQRAVVLSGTRDLIKAEDIVVH
ncbi:MAG TPA: sigma-54 dependent transcriptional regulator [Rectinemataceae bacterium]|nr:sigma-54 dependent transcriptional regulator [Rectinemataceae bacterium]